MEVANEQSLHLALKDFFLLLNSKNEINLYDFTLLILEFILNDNNNCKYLVYTPNSVNLLNIFQKVYVTLDKWVDNLSLQSLLFLAEIICKPNSNFHTYEFCTNTVLNKVTSYNTGLLTNNTLTPSQRVRIGLLIVYYYKDIEMNKIKAVEFVQKTKNLLKKYQETTNITDEASEDNKTPGIILPWVSFGD